MKALFMTFILILCLNTLANDTQENERYQDTAQGIKEFLIGGSAAYMGTKISEDAMSTEIKLIFQQNIDYLVFPNKDGVVLSPKEIKEKMPDLDFRFLSAQKEKDKDILRDVAKFSGEIPFEKADFRENMDLFAVFISNIIRKKFGSDDSIVRGPLKILNKSRAIFLNDMEIKFTPMEYEILFCLAYRPNNVYSKLQLYNRTKCDEVSSGTSEDTVVSHIKSIRDKLKKIDKNFNPIKTVTNYGYKYNYSRDSKF